MWQHLSVLAVSRGVMTELLPRAFSIGFLCLRSAHAIPFLVGVLTLGVGYHTLAVKGSHLASHNALTKSKSWGKVWAVFFIEVSVI